MPQERGGGGQVAAGARGEQPGGRAAGDGAAEDHGVREVPRRDGDGEPAAADQPGVPRAPHPQADRQLRLGPLLQPVPRADHARLVRLLQQISTNLPLPQVNGLFFMVPEI